MRDHLLHSNSFSDRLCLAVSSLQGHMSASWYRGVLLTSRSLTPMLKAIQQQCMVRHSCCNARINTIWTLSMSELVSDVRGTIADRLAFCSCLGQYTTSASPTGGSSSHVSHAVRDLSVPLTRCASADGLAYGL